MVSLVTLISYYVIIAKSDTVIDIAKDFLAMKVISEFDDVMYLEHTKENPLKDLIEHQDEDRFYDLLKIQTTTSEECVAEDNAFEIPTSIVWVNEYLKDIG